MLFEATVVVVDAWLITCDRAFWELLDEKFPVEGVKNALIPCVPTARDDVVIEATPPDSVAVPKIVLPSLKSTVPVGVAVLPAEVFDTVAVKVMDWPYVAGF